MNKSYDIIGDIHGYADNLKRLLAVLGYEKNGAAYGHPEGRKVVFLGDYIDRGPKIRESLQIVKSMVDAGDAIALMGNHEFNALAYHSPDGEGGWLRAHSPEKVKQHQASMEQIVEVDPEEWAVWMEWFRNLPLALELPGLRAAHAAWDERAVAMAGALGRLDDEKLHAMSRKGSELKKVKEILLNGMELKLPEGFHFSDKSGFKRRDIRLRWWDGLLGKSYRQAVFPDSESVPDLQIPAEFIAEHQAYGMSERPMFMGHYWMPVDSAVEPLAPNVACLDFSVAKGGSMVAYRWDGEQVLRAEKFVGEKVENYER